MSSASQVLSNSFTYLLLCIIKSSARTDCSSARLNSVIGAQCKAMKIRETDVCLEKL